MFKAVVMLRRRPGMTKDEFVRYYEDTHSRLGAQSVPNLRRYVRHYLEPFGRQVQEPDSAAYDAITEIWFDDEEQFLKGMGYLSEPVTAAKFAEDEPKLFDMSSIAFYTCMDYETDLETGLSLGQRAW